MFRPLFFNPPDSEAQLDTLNAAPPAADRDIYSERVRHIAGTAARLAGLPDPAGHAERPAAATCGRSATTPSTLLLPCSPERHSVTPPPHAKPPRRSPTCPHPSPLTCHPSPTTFARPKHRPSETYK